MKATLRKFENEDTPVLLNLFYETVHSINAKDYPADQLDAWAPERPDVKKWQSRFKSSKTIVAELDGKVVGFGNLEGKGIGMLYVHKDHQNQHVASTILQKLEAKLLKDEIFTAMVEASLTAKAFFEKNGYVLVRENRKMLNGRDFVNFIMEKKLSLKSDKPMKEKSKETSKPFKWRDLFVNKVFDLMIVIVGVSIAFQLNNIKLDADAKSLERFYLEGLKADVSADIEEMTENVDGLRKNMAAVALIKAQIAQPEFSIPLDSLAKGFGEIIGFNSLEQHSSTFDMIVNGNGLAAITDPNTRSMAAEFYGTYGGIRRFEAVNTEVIIRSFAFLYHSVDFTAGKMVDPSILTLTETKNFLLMMESQIDDGTRKYDESLEYAKRLLQLLENDLRK